MSRSYKKHSTYNDYSRNGTPYAKKCSRRAVRRYKGVIANGSAYKKIFPQWDIYDYKGLNLKSDIDVKMGHCGFVWLTQEEYDKGKRK